MSANKIAVYSLSDLKNTTDDALPNYLTSLKFRQSHFLTDVRLVLGYSAVFIAAVTFAADYKLGWDATKFWTFLAVLAYFSLNGALTFWIWGVEKGKVFMGQIDHPSAGYQVLSIASHVIKHTPIYNLTVQYTSQNGQKNVLELSSPFTCWFDADGLFIAKPFQQWLASEVPLIGLVDPSNKKTVIAHGETEATAVVVEQRYDASSTKTRKGKKSVDR